MGKFKTSLVGVTFEGRQENIRLVATGQKLFWKNEVDNPHDSNAILLFADEEMKVQLGHIRAELAGKLMERLNNKKCEYEMFADRVTGGGIDFLGRPKNYGLNIIVYTRWSK